MGLFTKSFSFFKKKDPYLGTVSGVYLPNILQMLGVILFLRLGWITGHVGVTSMVLIIAMSSGILLITGLSMTSIVTNLKMGGGGSYYIVSRSLGIEMGTALGVLLCCAQLTSIALCISGFVSSLEGMFPYFSPAVLEVFTLLVLSFLSYVSTNLAIKTQIAIFIALTISLVSVFMGKASNIPNTLQALPTETLTFWAAFSMFFPATTGIETGMALSGDLKNPGRSLPVGTLCAILTAYLLYTVLAIFLNHHIPPELLRSHPLIIQYLATSAPLVILGIWAATLSSALGGVMGTPRTIQAIANDGMLPKFLSKGYGITQLPRNATVVVFLLSAFLTVFTDINQLIPILTMICLTTYALINFLSFFESITQNPSWRPSFKTPWSLSLIGCIACLVSMFMVNAGATFIVLALLIFLYFWAGKRKIQTNWDDLRYSLFSSLARFATNKLSYLDINPKTWRPSILTVVDPSLRHKNLIFFSHSLNQGKGFLTYGTTTFSQDVKAVKKRFSQFFTTYKIPSFQRINVSHDLYYGIESLTRNYGFGPLQPNTIIFSHEKKEDSSLSYVTPLLSAFSQEKNVLVLKTSYPDTPSFTYPLFKKAPPKKIHLWWGGKYPANFELSLALAYLLQSGKIWAKSVIQINSLVKDEEEKKQVSEQLEKYKTFLRLPNLIFEVRFLSEKDPSQNIVEFSKSSDLTFLGLKPPYKGEQNLEEYSSYYTAFLQKTEEIPNIAYVLAGEKIDFEKIFE